MEGWELSPDRVKIYDKIMSMDPVGDPMIVTKCVLDKDRGLLVASDNGFSWRLKAGMGTPAYSRGKSKWVRWHDVANILLKKKGQVLVELKLRKKGSLILDGRGNPKIKKWKLTIRPHKDEPKTDYSQRQDYFHQILTDIYTRNRVEVDPPTSDSRI